MSGYDDFDLNIKAYGGGSDSAEPNSTADPVCFTVTVTIGVTGWHTCSDCVTEGSCSCGNCNETVTCNNICASHQGGVARC